MDDVEPMWSEASQLLREQVSEGVWFSTFHEVRAERDDDTGALVLHVPNAKVRERIVSRYRSMVDAALAEAGVELADVEVVIDEHQALLDASTGLPTVPLAPPPEATEEPSATVEGLNPRYTFETFVKGSSNQFALAAALRVAETPGRSYNPLFVYGSAGLGKTHLLQAIGHYVSENYAHSTVRYVSTEAFLNEYVDAIRTNSTPMFKRRYRQVDVLLIDDIQFMEGKEGLQEEFFHTFNSLHGANKQIVISSDRSPEAISTLEDRLRSRFNWGLITDIQPPDLETRLAILRNKAERDDAPISDDVLRFIATRVTTNIRDLEGALTRITAYTSLYNEPVTVGRAEELIEHLIRETPAPIITAPRIIELVGEFYGHPVEAIRGKSRQRPLVHARQLAMYLTRQLTDLSYPSIAREFGGRDHTTVMHACVKVERQMRERQRTYIEIGQLTERLMAGE